MASRYTAQKLRKTTVPGVGGDVPVIDLSLLSHQRKPFNSAARHVVYVKGRRAGGTEGGVRKLLQFCLDEDQGSSHLWVDTTHRNISRYLKRYFLPRIRPLRQQRKDAYSWNGHDLTLSFLNGSYVDFASAERPENIEGFAYDYVWLNEAGIILWNEELYNNTLLPMTFEGKGARIFYIGAPKGINLFHRFWLRAQSKEWPTWEGFHNTCFDNPVVNRALIEEEWKDFPESVRRQEYLAEFLDDANFFHGVGEIVTAELQQEPSPGASYVIGCDIARTEDYTVTWVMRVDTREAIFCERYSRVPWPEQVERIKHLSAKWNRAPIYLDATSLGGHIASEDLEIAGLSVARIVFTNERKAALMYALARDIENKNVSMYMHEPTVTELRAFQQHRLPSGKVRLAAPDGMHDDCVVALALAAHGAGRPYVSEVMTTPGGIASRFDELEPA